MNTEYTTPTAEEILANMRESYQFNWEQINEANRRETPRKEYSDNKKLILLKERINGQHKIRSLENENN